MILPEAVDSSSPYEQLQYMAAGAPSREAGYEIEDETIRVCIESGDCKAAEAFLAERMFEYEGRETKNAYHSCGI